MNQDKQILQLEVGRYEIVEDGTTLIEISIHNYKEIIKKEEHESSLASPFDRQTYLLDALLLSIYSKVHSERTISKFSFFSPIEFSCSEEDFRQIQEFVENAGYEDSFKFVFEDKDDDEEKEILYKLTNEKILLRKGFLNLYMVSDKFEEDFFSVKALTFSTPIPEDERYPEGFNREDVVNVEDTRKVTIPYVDIY
jgi:hypothetical protein